MKKSLLILVVVLVTLSLLCSFAACSKNADTEEAPYPGANDEISYKSANAGSTTKVILTSDRMMVYTVDTALTVKDYSEAATAIRATLAEAGGYEEGSYTSNSGMYRFTLRVPTEKLNDFLEKIAKSGEVEEQTVSGRDITDSYLNAENERDALIQKKAAFEALAAEATTFDEQLKIQEKILEVAAEIDRYNDRLSSYKKASDYSTVNITLYEEGTYEEPTFWDTLGETFFGSGRSIGRVFGFLLLVLVAVIPYAALIGAIFGVYTLIKFLICRGKKKPFKLFGHLIKDYSEKAQEKSEEKKE